MAKKAFGAGRIFGVTHGAAPALVLALPGWLHQASDWAAALGALDVGSVALDLPGFGGATPEPDEATGSAGYAELVEPVLDELVAAAGGPVVVAGHSFGGRVALQLAARRPDAVAGLLLTGVPKLVAPPSGSGGGSKPAASYRAARWLNRRGLLPDSKMEELRRKSGSADYRNAPSVIMRNVLVAVTNETYEEQLRAVRCPVELVWGRDDTAAPVATAEAAVGVLGAERAHLTVLDGVDHFTPVKAPSELAAALGRLLAHPESVL
jgi:pimeloyl-ACP methyl ester carboxylesterase